MQQQLVCMFDIPTLKCMQVGEKERSQAGKSKTTRKSNTKKKTKQEKQRFTPDMPKMCWVVCQNYRDGITH